jgi:basic membrane lipoprotein Med (substrate-binding protein (PBP1-ABC) superfamily)
VAVFRAVKRTQEGKFKGGTDMIATVANGGVGLGKLSAEGQKYADQVNQIQDKIAAGEVKNIPETVE